MTIDGLTLVSGGEVVARAESLDELSEVVRGLYNQGRLSMDEWLELTDEIVRREP